MTVQINYKNSAQSNKSNNLVLFVNEKYDTKGLKRQISSSELSYISDLLKNSDLKKNLIVFELTSSKKIILISIKKNIKNSDIESLGAELYKQINHGKNDEYFINSDNINVIHNNFIAYFLHGLKLKSYEFNKYKTKKKKLKSLS